MADELRGNRDPDGFVEREHSIRALAHEGYLELIVQRTLENLGKQVDEASLQIDLPGEQVATNLRTQGVVGGKIVWFQGELLDADVAASRYEYLTGYGQSLPKDPAWLYWTSPYSLELQVFPCPPHQPKTVEYRLIVPMAYADGKYSAEFVSLGGEGQRAAIELSAVEPRHRVSVNKHELSPGSRIKLPSDAETIQIDLVSQHAALVQGELAEVALGTGRSYLRAELRAKPKLSLIPRDAYLVFVFDMSRSVGDSWASQRHLFEQVAWQFPNAKIALLGFDRTLRRITEGFVSLDVAQEKLNAFPTQTRNGSRADLALKAATELFVRSKLPRERTRLFILSDARVAEKIGSVDIESMIRQLPATVQLAQVSQSSCQVKHAPDMPWIEAVESTSGTAWSVSTLEGGRACQADVEELARPKRLFVKAITLEGAITHVERPETLDEGQAFVHEAIVNGSARLLGFEAKLWGKLVSSQFRPDATMSRIRAALATTNEAFDLTDPELQRLAQHGGAVTRLTSYLAIEPGVRPSREGFGGGVGSGQGFGSGLGQLGASHTTVSHEKLFNRQAYIEQAVDEARKYCGVRFLRATVELETNFTELLDVVRAEVPDAPPSASGCLIERLWELALPAQFNQQHATFAVLR